MSQLSSWLELVSTAPCAGKLLCGKERATTVHRVLIHSQVAALLLCIFVVATATPVRVILALSTAFSAVKALLCRDAATLATIQRPAKPFQQMMHLQMENYGVSRLRLLGIHKQMICLLL